MAKPALLSSFHLLSINLWVQLLSLSVNSQIFQPFLISGPGLIQWARKYRTVAIQFYLQIVIVFQYDKYCAQIGAHTKGPALETSHSKNVPSLKVQLLKRPTLKMSHGTERSTLKTSHH